MDKKNVQKRKKNLTFEISKKNTLYYNIIISYITTRQFIM